MLLRCPHVLLATTPLVAASPPASRSGSPVGTCPRSRVGVAVPLAGQCWPGPREGALRPRSASRPAEPRITPGTPSEHPPGVTEGTQGSPPPVPRTRVTPGWGPGGLQSWGSSCHPHGHFVPSAAAVTGSILTLELCTSCHSTVVTTGQLCDQNSHNGFHTPSMISTTK